MTPAPACKGMPISLFYPDDHRNRDVLARKYREAKAVCVGCPVRQACLADALERDDQYGVWGGLSPRERDQLRGANR